MSILERFGTLDLKRLLLIDDAFAPPARQDISGEAVTLLNQELRDERGRAAKIQEKFQVSMDPRVPGEIDRALDDSELRLKLWKIRTEPGWGWLRSSLFGEYEEHLAPKIDALRPITEYFEKAEIRFSSYGTFDLAMEHIVEADIVFLDFFFQGETQPDGALARAAKLAQLLSRSRTELRSASLRYPLLVLFSTREEAARLAQQFKDSSTLRGCFFQFLPKAELAPERIEACLTRLVADYERNQSIAKILDEHWLAAIRVADKIKVCVQRLEPTDIALLQAAALVAEREELSHYLAWLIGLYASTELASDSRLKALAPEIVSVGSNLPLPGHIPASQTLSDLFIATTARRDVSDDWSDARKYEVTLGDVFIEGDIERVTEGPKRVLVVIDQSCNLKHASGKDRVLCLRGAQCEEVRDMALAVYDTDKLPTYFVGLKMGSKEALFRITWNLVDPDTVSREVLEERRNVRRVARFQDIIALQLQERYLQNLGRIGTAVPPPLVGAYSARLRLGKRKVELDARSKGWAAVTIVRGRGDSEMLYELLFCGEFVDWLKSELPMEFGSDRALERATKSLRSILEQPGPPKGRLKLPKDDGSRFLTLEGNPALKVTVVQMDGQFDGSEDDAVLQIVPYPARP